MNKIEELQFKVDSLQKELDELKAENKAYERVKIVKFEGAEKR